MATDELAERAVVLVAVLVTGGSSDRGRGLRLKDRTGEIPCEVSPLIICSICMYIILYERCNDDAVFFIYRFFFLWTVSTVL